VVRAEGDPLALVRPLQSELSALDPKLPLRDPTTLRALVDERFAGRWLPVLLMTAFGALALLLVSAGIYAMFASMASARERELAVRLALGSSRGAVAGLVLRQGAVWMAAGLAGGAVGLMLVSRLLGDLVHGIPPLDPPAIAMPVAGLAVCAGLALVGPVRRATRVDPAVALRA
jgi:ABC-type antimicrobial peptide transport system permease subunit